MVRNKIFALLIAILLLIPVVVGAKSGDISVQVDGKNVVFPDAKPYLDTKAGRVMVPISFVSKALSAKVTWDGKARIVTIDKQEQKIVITIGEKKVLVNDKYVLLDTAAVIKNNRTYVPVRFISNSFGLKVGWMDTQRTVVIKEVTNTFDPREVKVGDTVSEMKITSLRIGENYGNPYYSADVLFSGTVTILGTYEYHSNNDADENLRGKVTFTVDGKSTIRLPKVMQDERKAWFVFNNQEQAAKAFGPMGSKGNAQVTIRNYGIHLAPSEVWNTADFVKAENTTR